MVAARLIVVTDMQRSGFDGGMAALAGRFELISSATSAAPARNLAVIDARARSASRRRHRAQLRRRAARRPTCGWRRSARSRASARDHSRPATPSTSRSTSRARRRRVRRRDRRRGRVRGRQRPLCAQRDADAAALLIVDGAAGSGDGFYLSRALHRWRGRGPDFDVQTVTGSAFAAMTAHSCASSRSSSALDATASTAASATRCGRSSRPAADCSSPPRNDVDARSSSTVLDWTPPLAPRERAARGRAGRDRSAPSRLQAVRRGRRELRAGGVRARLADRSRRRLAGRRALHRGAAALLGAVRRARAAILLFTSDVDRRWNDFPLHPTFVPFAQEMARYLGARAPATAAARGGRAAGCSRQAWRRADAAAGRGSQRRSAREHHRSGRRQRSLRGS